MKSLHKIKAVDAYNGAKEVLDKEIVYPSYILLKESLRGTLAYMVEDSMDTDISDKTKLSKLLNLMSDNLISNEDVEKLDVLLEAERNGLGAIISMDICRLKEVRTVIKKMISTNLGERL